MHLTGQYNWTIFNGKELTLKLSTLGTKCHDSDMA